jgi:23S rRNA (adenine2030-N6)-methyltransferase
VLSYRHGFHAGSFVDVLKHTTLICILNYLNQKEAPYCYIDTHAGAGLYALSHRFMQKNKEYMTGIGKLFGEVTGDPALDQYLKIIQGFNPNQKLTQYPGSPKIAQAASREKDRLQLIELHPSDAQELQHQFAHSYRSKVFQMEASAGLFSFLPPKEKRGLIFIDPPYELDSEYTSVIELLKIAQQKFPTGTYALWYPIVERRKTEIFVRKISHLPFKHILRVEHCIAADGVNKGLTGHGMLIMNGPFNLKETLTPTLKKINERLTQDKGTYFIAELSPGAKITPKTEAKPEIKPSRFPARGEKPGFKTRFKTQPKTSD